MLRLRALIDSWIPSSGRWFLPLCLALVVCPGCGLFILPTVETFPAPVQHVSVRDARTGDPLPSATVEVEVVSVSTKANLFDTSGTNPMDEKEDVVRLRVSQESDASFTPHGTLRLAFWQCLWPLFSWATSGDWWYYGHKTRILVNSPGSAGMLIEYPAWSPAQRLREDDCTLVNGTLVVRLNPAGSQRESQNPVSSTMAGGSSAGPR